MLQSTLLRISVTLSAAVWLSATASAQTPPAAPDLSARLSHAAARITAINHEAERITDYNALRNLQQQWGYYVDKALWNEVTDLFADEGTLELGYNGVYDGKDAIRKYLYSLSGGKPGLMKGQLNNHFQFSPVITLSADGLTAQARWRAMIQDGIFGAGSGGNWGAVTYENQYVKQNGVWKIKKRIVLRDWTIALPLDKDWEQATSLQDGERAQSDASYAALGQAHLGNFSQQMIWRYPGVFNAVLNAGGGAGGGKGGKGEDQFDLGGAMRGDGAGLGMGGADKRDGIIQIGQGGFVEVEFGRAKVPGARRGAGKAEHSG